VGDAREGRQGVGCAARPPALLEIRRRRRAPAAAHRSAPLTHLPASFTVHYVGTLESDGSEFDSSRARGEPFGFTLGTGQVIKGWDAAVATMKKGEKSKITIRADYGYGDAGSPPKIPGGATLVFEVELLSWASVKDLAGDGGVIKTTLEEGAGWGSPGDRDEVKCTISARVAGAAAPFYASPAGGEAFTLAEGGLCRGVRLALSKMKKGEAARLKVAPEYGFGAAGRGADVPPDAALEVEVALEGWAKVEDVPDTDGGVVKKTLAEAEGWEKPNAGATVTVTYTGRLADGTVFDERAAAAPLVFVTEEGQAPCEGFEAAVAAMKKGERALATLAPAFAFGAVGAPAGSPWAPTAAVPPNAAVTYELELLDFQKAKDTWEMDAGEKVAAGVAAKDKGNAAFKAGALARAVRLWTRAQQAVEYEDAFDAAQKAAAKELKRACDLNLAAAHLKAGRHGEAAKAATKVLDADPGNAKALFRRAQARAALEEWVEAERDVRLGLAQEPDSADFKALARRLKAAEAAAAKKDAAMWAGAFRASAKAAGKKPAAVAPVDADGAGPSGAPAVETA
jgi:FK506-binding protein 4/5